MNSFQFWESITSPFPNILDYFTNILRFKKSQAECEQVRGEVNVFTARIRSLVKEGQEKHKMLQQENSDLSKEIEALKEEKMELLNKSNEAEMKMKKLNEDLNTSMGSLSNSESSKKRMNSDMESLKEAFNALKVKNEGLEAEIAHMNNYHTETAALNCI